MIRLVIMTFSALAGASAFAASPQEVAEEAMAGYWLFMRDSLPDDRQRGYDMMLSAAWEGDAKASNNIGWLLQHGEFVEKDLKGAFRWYERAADQGLPAAALNYMPLLGGLGLPVLRAVIAINRCVHRQQIGQGLLTVPAQMLEHALRMDGYLRLADAQRADTVFHLHHITVQTALPPDNRAVTRV